MPPKPIAFVAAAWCLAAALACAADHPPGKLLFEEDFSGREAGSIKLHGDGWSMAEGVLSQAREVGSRGAEIGDKSWKDLDVTFRVRARRGKKGHMVGLTGRGVWFAVREDLFQMVAGKRSAARQARQSTINRWVNVRVVFQGRSATFFADGERVGTLGTKSASGPVSLSTNGMAGDFDDVRVIVPEKGEKGLTGPPKAKNLLPNGSFEDVVDNMPVWWAPAPPFLDRYGTHRELRYRFGVRPDKSAPHGQR